MLTQGAANAISKLKAVNGVPVQVAFRKVHAPHWMSRAVGQQADVSVANVLFSPGLRPQSANVEDIAELECCVVCTDPIDYYMIGSTHHG